MDAESDGAETIFIEPQNGNILKGGKVLEDENLQDFYDRNGAAKAFSDEEKREKAAAEDRVKRAKNFNDAARENEGNTPIDDRQRRAFVYDKASATWRDTIGTKAELFSAGVPWDALGPLFE